MMNDIIADALTRIRNANMRKRDTATLVYAKIVEAILKIFKEKGYIDSYHVVEEAGKKNIQVNLKYENNKPVINEIKRISKSGRRVYKPASEIKQFKNGYGTIIITTSKGVLSNDEAHHQGVGGEVLCTIW
ncbi:MAG: small subunit ribosomal protein [Campylobacterota bacterium]|nr:small subunit ribosomal protein [Campylobacterota bacterium]